MPNEAVAGTGFLITDKASRVVFASSDIEAFFGFSVPEIIGKRPQDLWGGQMSKEYYAGLWNTISKLCEPHVGSVINRHKSGRSLEMEIHVAPLLDDNGRPEYFVAAHPDRLSADYSEFAAAFQTAFQPLTTSPVLQAAFLQTWLGCPLEPALIQSRQDLLKALRDRCITPLQERFRRRAEDRELVEQAQKNPDVFSRLYFRYAAIIRRFFASRINVGAVTVEDLTQEVFLRAFRALPVYRSTNASYQTYLMRIAHNLLVNHYRSTHALVSIDDQDWAGADKDLNGLLDLTHAISLLSVTDQAVLRRFYENGSSVRDIAVEFGRSENAVKLILSRARRKLRAFLK